MKTKDSSAVCIFCLKPGGQNTVEWTCPRCKKDKKENDIYYNHDIPISDCCNIRARASKWECSFCGKLNSAADDSDDEKITKKPFSGANYTGHEDSLERVRRGSEFLKKLKKPSKI